MSVYALMHDPIRIRIRASGAKAGVVNSHAASAPTHWDISSPAFQRLLLLFYGYLSPFNALHVLLCVTVKWVSWTSSIFDVTIREMMHVFEFIELVFPGLIIGETDAAHYYRLFN